MRSPPLWPYALAGSLLLHALLLFFLLADRATVRNSAESRPIEVQLIQTFRPAAPAPPARSRPPPAPRPVAEVPQAEGAAVTDAAAQTPMAEATEASGEAEAASPDASSISSGEAAAEAAPEAASFNALPPRIDLRFQVRYGIARGEQTLVWVSDGDTYTVTSVAAATGLAGVFYSGRFVQTSQGRVTAHGLVPEMFWDQRGDKRSSARFDSASGTLTYTPAQGASRQYPYREGTQDTVSLFFQLALAAPPADTAAYAVFNGKKLRHYAYAVLGEVTLDTALGPLRTLHLARTGTQDGRFEVWLAIDRHYLPIRVLRTDDKGNEVELLVASLSP